MAASHGSNTDVYGNGYVLSPFLNSASSSGNRDSAETTTFKKQSKTYIPGLKDTTIALEGIFDGVVDAVDDILFAALGAGTGIFSYIPEGNEVVGNRAFTADVIETSYEVNTEVGDVAQVSAELAMGDKGVFARGFVVRPMSAAGAAGQTAAIDSGVVSTANGGGIVVHATASSTLVAFMQDSADNVTFADLPGSISFGAVKGSQRLAVTGTIRRYTRVRWTGTGTFAAIVERY
jgi:hypothetical protein